MAALLAALSGWVGFAVYGEAASGHALDRRVVVLTRQNGELRAEISERSRELAAANDPGWLQEEARKLGYVFPGEHVYVVTSGAGAHPDSGGVTVPQLPIYSPTPAPPSSSPSAAPVADASGSSSAPTPRPPGPTPYQFSLPTPGH